ncbi:hypothetical protein FACS189452_04530 [Bacteroidia bacterium]|nr:hypothetical protein FACS189452_04530 [Bacteroidia bacterium]
MFIRMKTQEQNSEGLSVMPAFVAKCRRTLVTNVETIRGFAIVSVAAVLLSACANEVDKGVCGANPTYCSWSYNSNKELTIIGTGEMIKDAADLPRGTHYGWDKYRKEMTAVSISGVTAIGKDAFKRCDSLTSVNIGSGVVSIGTEAFNGCKKLTSVSIDNDLATIGTSAFYGCTGITALSIPKNVTTISPYAFYGCTGLTKVTIPNSVTEMGQRAFDGCIGITEINIGSGLTTVDGFVLGKMVNLTAINADKKNVKYSSVEGVLFAKDTSNLFEYPIGRQGAYSIPDGVIVVGGYAFNGATGLTSVTIPNSVDTIEDGAFRGCTALASVVVPEDVTTIGSYIFQGCTGLTSVYNYSTKPQNIENSYGVFYGVNLANVTLYVPAGSESTYQAARGWKRFGQILAIP